MYVLWSPYETSIGPMKKKIIESVINHYYRPNKRNFVSFKVLFIVFESVRVQDRCSLIGRILRKEIRENRELQNHYRLCFGLVIVSLMQ
jgi:hypothetical protein